MRHHHRVASTVLAAMRLASGAVLGLAAGCNSSPTAPDLICSLNSDCHSPLVCVFQHCHDQCNTSADCTPGPARCVPAPGMGGDTSTYHVCQLSSESTCTAGPCSSGEVCGTDQQCRAPCSASMPTCLQAQECALAVGVTACFDPNVPKDQPALADASILGDGGVEASTSASDAGEAIVSADATSSGDARVDASVVQSGGADASSDGVAPVDGPVDALTADAPSDDGGPVTVLATDQDNPHGIAVDGANLYWTTDEGVMMMSLSGGPPTMLASSPGGNDAIQSDGTYVYWTSAMQGAVWRAAIAAGSMRVLLAGMQDSSIALGQPQGIALDANHVYVTSTEGVWEMPKLGNGGSLTSLSDYATTGIVSDGTHVYYVDPTNGDILRDSGYLEASIQNTPFDIAVDSKNLYWTNSHGAASIMAFSLASNAEPVAIAMSQPSPEHITTDGVNVYWTNAGCPSGTCAGAGSIAKVAVGGATVVTIASGQSNPSSIVVGGDFVYWTNIGDRTVAKASKLN